MDFKGRNQIQGTSYFSGLSSQLAGWQCFTPTKKVLLSSPYCLSTALSYPRPGVSAVSPGMLDYKSKLRFPRTFTSLSHWLRQHDEAVNVKNREKDKTQRDQERKKETEKQAFKILFLSVPWVENIWAKALLFHLFPKCTLFHLLCVRERFNLQKLFCNLWLCPELSYTFNSVQSLSHVWLSATPWTAARQASLSITNSWNLLKLMSIKSVMPSNHLILCCPFLLLPSIFPSIRVFSDESVLCIRWPEYWRFILNISPSSEHPGLISFRIDWLDLLAVQGTLKSLLQHHCSKASIL